jgi:hypothetical protein
MAATASFKQQCPSCEAWVPIRDPNLIGKKIDCPKCKYRFVVEEPAEEAADEDQAETAAQQEKPGRKEGDAGRKRAAGDKGTAAKSKGGPRRRDGEDEEAGKGKRGKGSGGSAKLIVGVGLGVLAVGILVFVAIFIWWNANSDKQKQRMASQPSRNFAGTPAPTPAAAEPAAEEGEKPAATPAAVAAAAPALPGSIEVLSNLLPPDTEGVCDVRLRDLIRTALGRTAFATPGAFRSEAIQQKLGLAVGDIDFLLQAWNFTHNWSFQVIHTIKPINRDAVKTALQAREAPEGKIEDQEYFLLDRNPWLDSLGRMTFAMQLQIDSAQVPPHSGPRALRIVDDQTLVLADLEPMKQFLAVKGRFPPKAQPKEAPKDGESAGNETAGAGAPVIPRGRRFPAAPEPQPGETEAAPASSSSYLTINASLKNTLDLLARKQPVVSLAVDTQAARGRLPSPGLRILEETLNAATISRLALKTILTEASILGASLRLRDGFELTLAEDCQNEDAAQRRYTSIRRDEGPELAKLLSAALDTKVDLLEEQTTNPDNPFSRGGTPGSTGGVPRVQGYVPSPPRPGMIGPAGRIRTPYGSYGPYGIPGRGMVGAQQQAQEAPQPKPPGSTIKVDPPEKSVVLLTISLIDSGVNSRLLNGKIRQLVLQQKGYLDMAGGRLRVHDLGDAARRYVESHQQTFPRGTLKREIPTTRAGRPYEPKQRISWLAELLPYLGPEQNFLYRGIERNKSWNDPENLGAAATLVPQFLMPNYPQRTWWVRYPGMTEPTAATHFVGIAGVGLDAPDYSADDPATAKKLGIFGYDRITRSQDISDGASNTIMMAQVPPTYKRPWLAGGGSTVEGVPETGSIRPFVSPQPDGKRGTLVVMADGSVRFISENISDDVFKALCTIRGGETGVILDRDAPPVDRPDLSAEPPPPVVQTAPPTTAAAPVTGEWKEFTSKEGRFAVSFPSNPKEKNVSQPTPFGNFDIHVIGVDLPANAGGFMVTYFDLPEALAKQQGPNDQFINSFAQGFKATAPAGAKMAREVKKVTVNGMSGHEFAVEVPGKTTAHSRVFQVRNRLYQLLVVGPKGQITEADRQRFFESFKLMDNNE